MQSVEQSAWWFDTHHSQPNPNLQLAICRAICRMVSKILERYGYTEDGPRVELKFELVSQSKAKSSANAVFALLKQAYAAGKGAFFHVRDDDGLHNVFVDNVTAGRHNNSRHYMQLMATKGNNVSSAHACISSCICGPDDLLAPLPPCSPLCSQYGRSWGTRPWMRWRRQ